MSGMSTTESTRIPLCTSVSAASTSITGREARTTAAAREAGASGTGTSAAASQDIASMLRRRHAKDPIGFRRWEISRGALAPLFKN